MMPDDVCGRSFSDGPVHAVGDVIEVRDARTKEVHRYICASVDRLAAGPAVWSYHLVPASSVLDEATAICRAAAAD